MVAGSKYLVAFLCICVNATIRAPCPFVDVILVWSLVLLWRDRFMDASAFHVAAGVLHCRVIDAFLVCQRLVLGCE